MKAFIRGKTLLLMAVALLSVACGPTSRTATYQQTDTNQDYMQQAVSEKTGNMAMDSLLYSFRSLQEEMTELRETFSETIPQSLAQVTIPTQDLLDLPDGAKYGTSSGRATVEIQRYGDSYVATSRCDSVARLCARYERQVFRQRDTIDSLNASIKTLNSRIAQMALEARSNAVHSTYTATETKAPPLFNKRCLTIGALIGSAVTIGARALLKRLGIGGILKGFLSNIK